MRGYEFPGYGTVIKISKYVYVTFFDKNPLGGDQFCRN